MMRDDMFSGWGMRTIREGEARYNPMAYHNGSIWPHDTALVALGLARYGLKDDVVRLAEGLFAAAQQFELRRLPELFCGFGAARWRAADAVSDRVRAAGVVGGVVVADRAGAAGPRDRRAAAAASRSGSRGCRRRSNGCASRASRSATRSWTCCASGAATTSASA